MTDEHRRSAARKDGTGSPASGMGSEKSREGTSSDTTMCTPLKSPPSLPRRRLSSPEKVVANARNRLDT
jgi:hypothetical protein